MLLFLNNYVADLKSPARKGVPVRFRVRAPSPVPLTASTVCGTLENPPFGGFFRLWRFVGFRMFADFRVSELC
ncbi:hypothetical protein ACIGEI_23025, partial [Pseudomonas sp. NPDC078863]|uniref:hypothetical protein n=1 Tax=Pseudomonas sp. NPDC078863 TaxID=3364425 RepID=UPI0037CBFFBD